MFLNSPVLWTALGYFSGAIPFSVWLGRLFLRADMRGLGEGNPGAANACRVGAWRIGLPVLLLDFLKAALPPDLAYHVAAVTGWGLVPVAIAPLVGHAWSSFLGLPRGQGRERHVRGLEPA